MFDIASDNLHKFLGPLFRENDKLHLIFSLNFPVSYVVPNIKENLETVFDFWVIICMQKKNLSS